jgi:quercetin dioxygenase-like cupin family protein
VFARDWFAVRIGGSEVVRATLQPGWRWSEHVAPIAGTDLCQAPHFQVSLSGRVGVRMADGTEFEVGPGEVVVIPPGHDAWVIGDEPAVGIDWAERTSGRSPPTSHRTRT